MNNALEALLTASVPVLTLVISAIGAYIISFVNKKKEQIDASMKNETAKTYIDIVGDNAVNVVAALNQTLVENLKAANEDGKLTQDEIEEIKNKALTNLLSTLSEDTIDVLDKVFGDTETYLTNLIESTCVKLKKDVINTKIISESVQLLDDPEVRG